MRILKIIAVCILLFSSSNSFAIVSPDPTSKYNLKKIKVEDIERLTGTKLTLLQKIRFYILKKKLQKPKASQEITEQQKKWARASMLLGIGSILFFLLSGVLLAGFLFVLALTAAILAIIFGAKSLKGNSNTEGIIGVVTGGLTLALIVVGIIILAIAFSGFPF